MLAREVYSVFTRTYGIPLSPGALALLQTLSEEEVRGIAKILEGQKAVLTEDDVALARTRVKTRVGVSVEPVSYAGSGCRRYKALKEMAGPTKCIAELKEKEAGVVFAMAQDAPDGSLLLEDEESFVLAQNAQSECLIAPGICASYQGRKEKGVFVIDRVTLPGLPIQDSAAKNPESEKDPETSTNALFFSEFVATRENTRVLEDILAAYKEAGVEIAAVALMCSGKNRSLQNIHATVLNLAQGYSDIRFAILPSVDLPGIGFYPWGEHKTVANVTLTTNPASILVGGSRVLVGMFAHTMSALGKEVAGKSGTDCKSAEKTDTSKETGTYRAKIGDLFLSQLSHNPFVQYADLSETRAHVGIVHGSFCDSFVHSNSQRSFAVCGPFSSSAPQFIFFCSETGLFEVSRA